MQFSGPLLVDTSINWKNIRFISTGSCIMTSQIASLSQKYHFCAKLAWYSLIFHIRPNLRSNFYYYRCLKRFKMNLCISKVFGSRGGATEILTVISVQKCQFLAISEYWKIVYACCSFKLIINNECLVYIHSLDFALRLIIYVTKIRQFHVS